VTIIEPKLLAHPADPIGSPVLGRLTDPSEVGPALGVAFTLRSFFSSGLVIGLGRGSRADHLILLELGGSNDIKNPWP